MFRLNPYYRVWEDNPVSWGWEQFPGTYVLRCVSFNRFWFFYAFSAMVAELNNLGLRTHRPKLAIFIPS
jgi:hypothetical protein